MNVKKKILAARKKTSGSINIGLDLYIGSLEALKTRVKRDSSVTDPRIQPIQSLIRYLENKKKLISPSFYNKSIEYASGCLEALTNDIVALTSENTDADIFMAEIFPLLASILLSLFLKFKIRSKDFILNQEQKKAFLSQLGDLVDNILFEHSFTDRKTIFQLCSAVVDISGSILLKNTLKANATSRKRPLSILPAEYVNDYRNLLLTSFEPTSDIHSFLTSLNATDLVKVRPSYGQQLICPCCSIVKGVLIPALGLSSSVLKDGLRRAYLQHFESKTHTSSIESLNENDHQLVLPQGMTGELISTIGEKYPLVPVILQTVIDNYQKAPQGMRYSPELLDFFSLVATKYGNQAAISVSKQICGPFHHRTIQRHLIQVYERMNKQSLPAHRIRICQDGTSLTPSYQIKKCSSKRYLCHITGLCAPFSLIHIKSLADFADFLEFILEFDISVATSIHVILASSLSTKKNNRLVYQLPLTVPSSELVKQLGSITYNLLSECSPDFIIQDSLSSQASVSILSWNLDTNLFPDMPIYRDPSLIFSSLRVLPLNENDPCSSCPAYAVETLFDSLETSSIGTKELFRKWNNSISKLIQMPSSEIPDACLSLFSMPIQLAVKPPYLLGDKLATTALNLHELSDYLLLDTPLWNISADIPHPIGYIPDIYHVIKRVICHLKNKGWCLPTSFLSTNHYLLEDPKSSESLWIQKFDPQDHEQAVNFLNHPPAHAETSWILKSFLSVFRLVTTPNCSNIPNLISNGFVGLFSILILGTLQRQFKVPTLYRIPTGIVLDASILVHSMLVSFTLEKEYYPDESSFFDCNTTRSNESYFGTARTCTRTRNSFTYPQFLETSRRISASVFLDDSISKDRDGSIHHSTLPNLNSTVESFKSALKLACEQAPPTVSALLLQENFVNTTGLNFKFFKCTKSFFGLKIPFFLEDQIFWEPGVGSGNRRIPLFEYGTLVNDISALSTTTTDTEQTVVQVFGDIALPEASTSSLNALQQDIDSMTALKSRLGEVLPKAIFVGRTGQGRYGRVKLHQKTFLPGALDSTANLVIGSLLNQKRILHIRSKLTTSSFRPVLSSSHPTTSNQVIIVVEFDGVISVTDPIVEMEMEDLLDDDDLL